MKSHRSIHLLIAAVIAMTAAPDTAQDEHPSARQLADNAALVYWQAFMAVPDIPEAHNLAFHRFDAANPSVEIQYIMAKSEPALELLHEASAMDRAVWNIAGAQPLKSNVAFLGPAQRLGQIALIRARIHAAADRSDEAADDVLAVARMGRHLAAEPVTSLQIQGRNIQALAVYTLREMLYKFDEATLRSLIKQIQQLPETATPTAMLDRQIAGLEALAENLAEAANSESALRSVFDKHVGEQATDLLFHERLPFTIGPDGRNYTLPADTTLRDYYLEGVRASIDLAREARQTLAGDNRPDNMRAFWQQYQQKAFKTMHEQYNRVGRLAAITTGRVSARLGQWTMVEAAARHFLSGTDAAESVRDPRTGNPYKIELEDGWLVVAATAEDHGAALSLPFPTSDEAATRSGRGWRGHSDRRDDAGRTRDQN